MLTGDAAGVKGFSLPTRFLRSPEGRTKKTNNMANDSSFPDLSPTPPAPLRSRERHWLAWFAGAAALLVLALLFMVVARHGAPLAPDAWARRFVSAHAAPGLTLLARVLDDVGNYYMVVVYGLAAAAYAWTRGDRRVAAGAFAVPAGLALWLELIKRAVDRARPAGAVIPEFGKSFPSGHAAGMIGFCLLAAALARRYLRAGTARGAAAVGLVCFAAVMGLSRVYLQVHYLTDVVAGWLLGGAWFCACWWWVEAGEVPPWEK